MVRPGDPTALATAIRTLLEDPARADRMGRAARERAVERHSLDTQAARLQEIYAKVAG